jgi:formyl-CoA transferase
MSLNGAPDGPPVKGPTYLGDDFAALHAALAGLAALNHRDRTGEGQHVDVSLLESVLFQSNGLPTLGATGVPIERWGSETAVAVPCATYGCRDGYVYIAVALDAHWRRLAAVIGRPELATAAGLRTNAERVANRDAANAPVAEWCRARTTEEVTAALDAVGIAASRVYSYEQAVELDHVRQREVLVDVTLANGTSAPLVAPAAKFSRTPTRIRRPAPTTGQHDEEVLEMLGTDRPPATEVPAAERR